MGRIREGSRIGLSRWNRLGKNIRTSVLHGVSIVRLNIYYTDMYLLGHEVNTFLTVSYSERKGGREERWKKGKTDRRAHCGSPSSSGPAQSSLYDVMQCYAMRTVYQPRGHALTYMHPSKPPQDTARPPTTEPRARVGARTPPRWKTMCGMTERQ